MQLTSDAFAHNRPIPKRYTADGEDIAPPLQWSDLPDGTAELALICDDPDAPRDEPFVHWIVYHLPPKSALPEGADTVGRAAAPPGMILGTNSFGRVGYGGPAPPKGHGTHHYHFKLYALDTRLNLEGAVEKPQLVDAMQGHILDQTELIGTYERPGG